MSERTGSTLALITNLAVVAVCALVAFVLGGELTVKDPIMDFTVFTNRNFALGTTFIATAVFTFYSSMLLLALYTQKLLGVRRVVVGGRCWRRAGSAASSRCSSPAAS